MITTLDRCIPEIEESLRSAGFLEHCASIRATELGVLDLEGDEECTRRRFVAEGRPSRGAEVLCLGCDGMSGIEKELGVRVIDGIVAAVKLAEACRDYGVSTSKVRTFAWPRPKLIPGGHGRPPQRPSAGAYRAQTRASAA